MSDLPVAELMKMADEVLERPGAEVYFKWTCESCGSRQTFEEPNTLHASGCCEECGAVTKIEQGGFAVVFRT